VVASAIVLSCSRRPGASSSDAHDARSRTVDVAPDAGEPSSDDDVIPRGANTPSARYSAVEKPVAAAKCSASTSKPRLE